MSSLLCILTSFRLLRASKCWSKHFFQPFSTFLLLFKCFSMNFHLKSRKNCVLSYSLKLVDMQRLVNSLRGYTFFLDFRWKLIEKHLKEEKRLKTAEKKCFDNLSGACSTWKLVKIHSNSWFHRLGHQKIKVECILRMLRKFGERK